MAESTIITGQFVRISQTPASIGERLIALAIDYILLGFYVFSTLALFSRIHLPSDFTMLFFFAIVYLPVLLYAFLCEMFNQGQSFGKRLMNIRVVKADGSTPGIGSYLLRWLLFPIDGPVTGGLGLLVVLLTKNSQRMGDLAAGTMVIKEKNYRKIHVSLDEFDYLTKDYRPTYPQASDVDAETNEAKAWYGKFNLDFLVRAGIVYNTGKYYVGTSFVGKNYNYHRNNFSVDNGFGTLQIYAGFNFNTRKEYRKKK